MKPKTLTSKALQVLGVISQTPGPHTHRSIAASLGLKSHRYISVMIDELRDAGLIASEPHQGGTIRPTFTVEIMP